MLRTVASLTRVDRGFDADGLLTLQLSLTGGQFRSDESLVAFHRRVIERLRALPGVADVSLAGQIPFARAGGGVGDCWRFHAAGRTEANPADDPCVENYSVTPGYFGVMGVPVLAGRAFTGDDTATSQRVVVISASTAARVWGAVDPIGAQVRLGNSQAWRTVVGVVGDVHADDLAAPMAPAMYLPATQLTPAYVTVLVKSATGDPASLSGAARRALREIDPTVPVYGVATLASLVERSSAQRDFVTRVLAAFAGAAVLLAAVGLYGVVSFGVAQRTREIGVRLALGAQPRDVRRLVLGRGFTLVAIGLGAGLAAAYGVTRILGTLVYGVSHVDPATFAAAAGLLIVVALLAHWVPLRRALRIDPASALRTE
jgi:putative ABC transport system permease protein